MNFDVLGHMINNLKQENHGVDWIDNKGITMLHLACARFDLEWTRRLLEEGASVNAQVYVDANLRWAGCTPLHILMLEAGIVENNPENVRAIAKLLLDWGADVTIMDESGSTPIHLSLKAHPLRNVFAIKPTIDLLLRQHTAFTENPVDAHGLSYLHLACVTNNTEMVQQYLKHGFDVNQAVNLSDDLSAGYKPLHFAIAYGSEDVAKILLWYKADVNAKDSMGNTPLHVIIKNEVLPTNLILLLLSKGADLIAMNVQYETLLEVLVKSQKLKSEHVQFFTDLGCRFNVVNPATREGLIAKIIKNDPQGLPPVEQLLFNTITKAPDIKESDENGYSAIHNIVSTYARGISLTALSPQDYADAIERLMKIGCDIDHKDKEGRTAMHIAVKFKNVEAIIGLLMVGADIDIMNDKNMSPFVLSLEENYSYNPVVVSIFTLHVRKLLRAGLPVSALNLALYQKTRELYPLDDETRRNGEEELEKMRSVKFSSCWSMWDFLSKLGPTADYALMLPIERSTVDKFFSSNSNVRKNFHMFGCLLTLRYKQAVARLKLVRPALDALISVGIPLPDLCLETILKFYTNDELQYLIESTEKESKLCQFGELSL